MEGLVMAFDVLAGRVWLTPILRFAEEFWGRLLKESVQFQHLFAAVRRIANQTLRFCIDHKIEHFQGHLSDQDRAFVGKFKYVTSAFPVLHNNAGAAIYFQRRHAASRADGSRP